MVVERVWKKVKGWKKKFLSTAGKEILIKAVAQAIPTYIMSCLKIPDSVCHEIESMLANFWWGARNGERKIHWMSWEKLSKAKGAGRLRFRGISEFNSCLLGKQYWRLLSQENSLVGKVFKGKYFPRGTIEDCALGYNPSYAWRSILGAREVVQRGSRWRIRNGNKVKILKDRWIPNNYGFKLLFGVEDVDDNARVCDLINGDLAVWKEDVISEKFSPEEAKRIVSIPLSRLPTEDKIIWHFEKNGEFSVKTTYHAARAHKESLLPRPSISPNQKL
ncbi:uncharacterized mitochondrial protein AtMg00310-like [Vicia villosa]|uniref:uncharacterized mitochondrial protein AtMg00310-like n=1 Tax=Vicia villosa TaxID=3911 RepID=UPI00273ADABA|nr:uncharacterized mitochondrial protein AtMg00310-like [Vicia villosa]